MTEAAVTAGCGNDCKTTIARLKQVVWARERDLKDCANELCYRCGAYQQEHAGACNGCRWAPIRRGEYE